MSEQAGVIKELVDRFLMWPLPKSVCSDLCATNPKYPYPRSGTNLLGADEARQMVEHVFGPTLATAEAAALERAAKVADERAEHWRALSREAHNQRQYQYADRCDVRYEVASDLAQRLRALIPAGHSPAPAGEAQVERLRAALDRSVRLQSHYAELLNIYDGGQRMQFASAEEWMKRLEEIGHGRD